MSPLLSSDVLTPRRSTFVAERLPEPPRAPRGHRPYSNQELLPGILGVLRSGCRWRDLDRSSSPSGVTHWRRLRYWHRRTGYRRVWLKADGHDVVAGVIEPGCGVCCDQPSSLAPRAKQALRDVLDQDVSRS